MNKIALFSDLHIGSHQNSEKWHSVCIQWLKWFKQSCLNNGVKSIIFCGDFYDTRHELNNKSLNIGKVVIECLRNDFELHLLVGNHDCYLKDDNKINSLNIFKGLPNVYVYDNVETVNIENVKFTLVPWTKENNNIPQTDVICGHFEINDFKMTETKICEGKIDAKNLLVKAPLIFSGHFHNRQAKSYSKYKSKIEYIGNPFQLTFGERDYEKGYILFNPINKTYTFIENKISPKHIVLKCNSYNENIDVKNNIIKIIYETSEELENNKIYSHIQTNNPFEIVTEFINTDSKIDNVLVDDSLKIEEMFESYIDSMNFEYKKELAEYITQKYKKITG